MVLPYGLSDIIDSVVSRLPGGIDKTKAREYLEYYVIAHELSHISHRDAVIGSIVKTIVEYTRYLIIPVFLGSFVLPVI